MTIEYPGEPGEYTFGTQFNYDLWNNNTRLTLTNVSWNSDYRDIVEFPTPSGVSLNQYIDALGSASATIQGMSALPRDRPVKINLPINIASRYNYIRASNPVQPGISDTQVDYYYFITNTRYIAGNTTELTVQLDRWQTYGKLVKFGQCFIDRGHIGIANSKAFNNYGRDYLTKLEGIDVGGEYQVKAVRSEKAMSIISNSYDILVASNVDLRAAATDGEGRPQTIGAKGGLFSGLPAGCSYYVFNTIGDFQSYLGRMASTPWVTQGIISITVIPPITRYIPSFVYDGANGFTDAPAATTPAKGHAMATGWREAFAALIKGDRYRNLDKLMVYPYTVVEMTTWSATPVILKPESWNDPDATIVERAALVPPNQRIAYYPFKYNAFHDDVGGIASDDFGEFLDIATMISNFPTMGILNNAAIGYMASNFNANAFAFSSNDWANQKAGAGAQASYDTASMGMLTNRNMAANAINNDQAQTVLGNQTQATQAALGAVTEIGRGVANGGVGAVGGVASAAGNMMSTAVQVGHNNAALGLRSTNTRANTGTQNEMAGFSRDTNKALADFVNQGDYQNTIAGIQARIQDANVLQPTTSGQVGGDALNLIHDRSEVSVRWKTIDASARAVIGEYWLRYGYAVQQFAEITQLSVMEKFTYWKLAETYITAAPMPEEVKQTIRGIFEKGVTVWADPAYIGRTDLADNEPKAGITL